MIEEFLSKYGADIVMALINIANAAAVITAYIKMKRSERQTKSDIQITQEGIVKAFKEAKLPSEVKVSLSNQLDAKFNNWSKDFLKEYEQREEQKMALILANAKILSYTQAFNKLDDETKAKIKDAINQISENDKTIEV